MPANWLRRRAAFLASVSVAGLALPLFSRQFAASAGNPAWLLDLLTHWQWFFLPLLLLATGIAIACGGKAWGFCLLAAPLPWLSASPLLPQASANTVPFSIASANVHFENRDVQALLQWLSQEKPDLLVLLEISPDYAAGLESFPDFLADYPHRVLAAEHSPFGIAVLSRQPLLQHDIVRDSEGIACIEAQLEAGGQKIAVTAFHPMPPLSAKYHAARNRKLQELSAAASKRPALIAGDLNATPWSSAFASLEQQGWRRATGLVPTWPAAAGGLFGIPIDHVLASPGWSLQSSTVGPDLGSDHLPVLARLVLNKE